MLWICPQMHVKVLQNHNANGSSSKWQTMTNPRTITVSFSFCHLTISFVVAYGLEAFLMPLAGHAEAGWLVGGRKRPRQVRKALLEQLVEVDTAKHLPAPSNYWCFLVGFKWLRAMKLGKKCKNAFWRSLTLRESSVRSSTWVVGPPTTRLPMFRWL